ncbi:MAG: hypothetical protein COB35_05425 [Gammaproteobacteria bacterium]|nr:MAG: hypothetical protein COB35_05425 [Gammaproteobacteria bacterium]
MVFNLKIAKQQTTLIGLFLSCWLLFFSSTVFAKIKVNFTGINLDSPYSFIHPLIIADILPQQGKEIVTITIDENSTRWLIIYGISKTIQ